MGSARLISFVRSYWQTWVVVLGPLIFCPILFCQTETLQVGFEENFKISLQGSPKKHLNLHVLVQLHVLGGLHDTGSCPSVVDD